MGVVIALDPSVRSAGLAVFVGGDLTHASRHHFKVVDSEPKASRVMRIAHSLRAAITLTSTAFGDDTTYVYEWPQIYTREKSKGNPNGLLLTFAPALVLAGLLPQHKVLAPTPAEWAGQTKKATRGDPWKSQRASMIARRLAPVERAIVPPSHDAIDAVGLGLWALGRFERKRVNSGATPG